MARTSTDECQEKRHEKSSRSNFKRGTESFSREIKRRKLHWITIDSQVDQTVFEK